MMILSSNQCILYRLLNRRVRSVPTYSLQSSNELHILLLHMQDLVAI